MRGQTPTPSLVGPVHPDRSPPNRRTPPQFPIYVSKRPTMRQISPYLKDFKAFPPHGGRWLAAGQTDEGAWESSTPL